MAKLTHKGVLIGCDGRTPKGYRHIVKLRETKNFWVGEHGTKYKKTYGYPVGEKWPMYKLVLDSIVPLKEAQ